MSWTRSASPNLRNDSAAFLPCSMSACPLASFTMKRASLCSSIVQVAGSDARSRASAPLGRFQQFPTFLDLFACLVSFSSGAPVGQRIGGWRTVCG